MNLVKVKALAVCFLLEALRGESVSLPFLASRGHIHSLARGSFLPCIIQTP